MSVEQFEIVDRILSEEEMKAAIEVRGQLEGVLPAEYDTDFNLLRWITYWQADVEQIVSHLRNHLTWCKLMDLDVTENTADEEDWEFYEKYIPIGLVGPTGKNNKVLMIELAGRNDMEGLMKSVQKTNYLKHRFRLFERAQTMVMQLEKENNCKSGIVYIYDLAELELGTNLLSIVTGPFKIMWQHIYNNYPDLIDTIILVNVPTFMNVIWGAFSPFVQDRIKEKVKFLSSNWKEELLEYVEVDRLPVHWGGTLTDQNGDQMCREMITVPPGKVPPEMYWKPKDEEPAIDDLTTATVYAGEKMMIGFPVSDIQAKMELFLYSDQEFAFGIYFSKNESLNWEEIEMLVPENTYPAMSTIDTFSIQCHKSGVYFLKFGNEQAWFLSINPKYSVRLWDDKGKYTEAKSTVTYEE